MSRRAAGLRASMVAIAEEAGVSQSTVSRVLNGVIKEKHPRAAARAARIRAIAQRHGYRINTSARATRMGRFEAVGVIGRSGVGAVHQAVVDGVCFAMGERGWMVAVSETPLEEIALPGRTPKLLRDLCVDGLIVHSGRNVPHETIEMIRCSGAPVIWANVQEGDDCAYPDDVQGGRLAAETLLELGHRRIAHLGLKQSDTAPHSASQWRCDGYARAMRDAGLTDAVVPLPRQDSVERRVLAVGRVLDRTPRPSAVIGTVSDAVALLIAAAERGLRVPRDLSLIVFAEESTHRIFGGPVSEMMVPLQATGRCAAEMLMRKVAEPQAALPPEAMPFDPPSLVTISVPSAP